MNPPIYYVYNLHTQSLFNKKINYKTQINDDHFKSKGCFKNHN